MLRSERGSVAIQLALMMIVILGMVGLGVEITFVMYKQRQMQSVADSAALGGVTALMRGFPADFRVESRAVATAAGFTNGVGSVTVSVNRPPTLGSHAGDASAIEVIVSQPLFLGLVSLFREGLFQVGARAVATLGGSGSGCVLQTLSTNTTGVSISNGAVVNLEQCGINVNATNSSALSVTGGAVLNAKFVSVSGGTSVNNGAKINATDGIKTNQPVAPDPYASVPQPSYSGCDYNNTSLGHSNKGLQTISPGVYCKGLAFTNDAIIAMNPGVYIIDRGSFAVGGAVQLTGTGVTIFLTTSTGKAKDYADVSIGNGAQVNLTAPTSGATAGLAFFGDRNGPLNNTSTFGGGAALKITGAIYFPSQSVTFDNGISNPSGCTQLIAGYIKFSGGARFQNNCANTGISPIGGSTTQLVE